jgi:hypothetical protein
MNNSKTEMSQDERRAMIWLEAHGYECAFEPMTVAAGRKPDFFARGPNDPKTLWVEVKSLDPEDVSIARAMAWDVAHATALPEGLTGYGMIHVDEDTREQSVRSVLNMFIRHAPTYREQKIKLFFVQQNVNSREMRRVEFRDKQPPEIFWFRGADERKLSVPIGEFEDGLRMATIINDGIEETLEAYNLFDWNERFECALVAHLEPLDNHFSISAMGGGDVTVGDRVRSKVEDANRQIKNANNYVSAPGIVMIFPPPHEYADDYQIAAGLYGRLMMPISIGNGKSGPMQHGPDAVFQLNKNRNTSAVVRLYNGDKNGMYFPNLFAHQPIDANALLFRDLVCYPPAIQSLTST